MADTFRDMPEIPGGLKHIWKGLEMREETFRQHTEIIHIPYGFEGAAIATTNVLVIRAQLVLNVERWYWYYGPAMNGAAAGWQGMEGQWNNIYADGAWVEARGLVQQKPENPWATDTPKWWSCVVIDENPVLRRYVDSHSVGI